MKKNHFNIGKIINVVVLSLITGLLCFSCTKEITLEGEGGKGGSSTGEEGMLSLSLKIDATKAGEEAGTDGENNIKNIRVILYALNGSADEAEYIFDYDLTKGEPGLINETRYQTKAVSVKKQEYRLVVLVNYFNPDILSTNNILADATAELGHPITAVTNPINYYNSSPGMWKGAAFNFLTGYDDSTPVTVGNDPEADGLFFMSNANSVTQITEDMILASDELAETYPVAVQVERGVAKVSVSKGNQFESNLELGASLYDFSWRVDIMNMRMYPLRRPTYIAPYGAGKGTMEKAGTDRYDRYAIDPNFDNVSRERNSSATGAAVNANFERIIDGADPRTGQQYFGQLYMAEPGAITAYNFEYVLENTMDAGEQYEDVTTRVLFRGNYVPPCTTLPAYNRPVEVSLDISGLKVAGSAATRSMYDPDGPITACFAEGESYFSYNGVAFSEEQMRIMFNNPDGRIPNDPRLRGLYDIFTSSEVIPNPDFGNTDKEFNINFSPINPYFNDNDPLGGPNDNPYGLPNWPWNQEFFDKYAVSNWRATNYVSSSNRDLVADGAPLSSIPYCWWAGYTTTNDQYEYDPEGSYDPEAPDFINVYTPYFEYRLKDEFIKEFAWLFDEEPSDEDKVAKSWKGINYHVGGISYYYTLIRHFDNSQSPERMGYGRYGVVRNNHYKLAVNRISGPGSPVIPEPGGENDGNKWISVSVEVLPWLVRYQTMPLK